MSRNEESLQSAGASACVEIGAAILHSACVIGVRVSIDDVMLRFCLLQHLRESCQAVIIETHHLIHPPEAPQSDPHSLPSQHQDRLDELAPAGSPEECLPFKHKAKYFGFTIDDTDRHKKHDVGNTNWLKVLYHSILKVEFHDEDGQPELAWHHYVVDFPVSVDECHLGEEIFCQIENGYYYTGLGFNIQPAGIAVSSAYLDKHTPKAAAEKWSTAEQWREEGPDWNHQLEHEVTVNMPKYTAEQKEKVLAKKAAKEKKQNNPPR
jgi:hypothetical protein